MAKSRSSTLGPATRPVAVPRQLDDGPKAEGVVVLPPHIRWSGPQIAYDLDNRRDLVRVYEQVLREGTEADVRYFIRSDRLLDLWEELVLPPNVRRAWSRWIRRQRQLR